MSEIERINYIDPISKKLGVKRVSRFVGPEEYPEKVPLKLNGREVPNYFITKEGVVLRLNKSGSEMKVLVLTTRKDGNVVCGISGKVIQLHCLIVESFVPDLNPRYYVKHRDGNKSNNAISNLLCFEASPK